MLMGNVKAGLWVMGNINLPFSNFLKDHEHLEPMARGFQPLIAGKYIY